MTLTPAQTFQGPQLLIPVRKFVDMSNGGNWICLDDANLGHRIIFEDKEVFSIDWRSLDCHTGFDLPNLAVSASVPDVYVRNIDKVEKILTTKV